MADYTRFSDADLIARCLDQDAEAWEMLIRRYQRLIASITFKYGLSSEDAADIAQSVCFTLFQQLPSLRKQDKLSSWIITVTVRECWKFRRREVRTDSLDNPERENHLELADQSQRLPDEWLLSLERHHLLQQAVELLPDQCRRLIENLFYGEEALPYAEISRRMGMPVASIGPTRARCLEKLRASLKKIGFL
jgi:RNA polymerase sigma factor (sigma-70 family)